MKRNESLALTSCAHTCRNSEGALTCSITSIEHTTSYCFPSSNNASAVVCRYFKDLADRANGGSPAACVEAIPMFASEASIPVVLAPSLARLWQNFQHSLEKHGQDMPHLGQQPSATSNVEDVESLQRSRTRRSGKGSFLQLDLLQLLLDKIHSDRVHFVQHGELAAFIPPLRR